MIIAITMRVLLPNHPKRMVAPCLWHGEGLLDTASLGNIRTIASGGRNAIAPMLIEEIAKLMVKHKLAFYFTQVIWGKFLISSITGRDLL
jgi:hypothetical protein